jgi:UDP-N-acetylmuramyl tripeptide synthase
VASVARVVRAALEEHPALVVADRDDPVVAALAAGLPRVVWVSTGARWSRDRTAWADGAPPAPEPDWFLQAQAAVGPAGRVRLSLQLPGAFNAGNALVALAAADALGVPAREAAAAMAEVRSVAGRYGAVLHDGRRVQLHLAKNPAGWQETLPLLADRPALALALNAREPDGRDTSWLWDVPLERLPRVPVVACGEAAADLGLRLTYAGIEHRTEPEPLAALAALPPGDVTLVANYTAFTDVLRRLQPAP